ncbi:receptor-like protein 9a isoform X2 [Populus nigra]|uniref:receptor-like protein 9a isoform X2 n=1 Tax=Populus nigra TaxID=3691 RepID=UPI002B27B8E6|nr:receptor-like protein 9a isoform X2 [Populus nigra]
MAPPYLPGENATPTVVNGKVLSAAAEQAESPDSYLWSVRNEELGDWYLNVSLFLPFQQLNSLILMDNRIAGWVEKKGGYGLHKLSNLKILALEDNSFNNSILSFVEGLPSLKTLYLDYNRLEGLIDLKESLSSLKHLGLGGNNINKLVASRGPSSLNTLYLGKITTYGNMSLLLQSLGAFPNLTTLFLHHNDFTGRKLGDGVLHFRNLKFLNLSYNTLNNNSILQTIILLLSCWGFLC